MQNERNKNRQPGRSGRRWLIWTLGAALLAQPLTLALPVFAAAADSATGTAGTTSTPGTTAATGTSVQAALQQLAQTNSEMITSGAKRVDYTWTSKPGTGAALSKVHVIEVDLTNPYVKLDVMNGKPGSVSGVNSVANMVSAYGAVAGVNGDYFNTTNGKGAPIGAEVTGGQLVSTPSQLTGMYAFALTGDRQPTIDTYGFDGTVTAADGSTFKLSGINKAAYMTEPDNAFSHANAMYIYTSAWTQTRPDVSDSSTTPTEVLVQNGVVTQFADNKMIAGNVPADGYILRVHGKAAEFARAHLQVGTTVKADYRLIAQSTGRQVDPNALQMLIGGHTILVDSGKAATFSRNTSSISPSSDRARTALGYTKDGKKALIIAVEDSGNSQGATLAELQQIMVQLGVWKGMNLDGGGSTTMVARPLGDMTAQLAFPTEYGTTQRLVANGLGVFSTAPAGPLMGIKASGSNVLFVGQQATYAMKAYDSYYNPVDPGTLKPTWKLGSPLGNFAGNTFTATKAGQTTITVQAGTVSDKLPIEVVGGDAIASMTIDASSLVLEQGKTISLPVRAVLKDGRKLSVPASSIKWELRGFTGTVKDGALTIGTVNAAAPAGYVIARYDGFSAMAVLAAGADKKFDDFEKPTYPISFQGTNGVGGTSGIVTGLPGTNSSGVVQLQYDFTNGTGTKAAYAVLNGTGRQVDGSPSGMTIDVMGDASLNWVRAEFIDAAGKAHLMTLAKQVDWSGWKTIKVDLSGEAMGASAKLKRLYVASLEDGQDERQLIGTLAFDNIAFQYPAVVADPPRTRIDLKLGSKNAVVGGQAYKLDVAPLLLDGTTYLPLRFVTEAMGAQIDWDAALKRVTVLRGGQMLDMWVGRKDYLLNGTRKQSEVAPITRSGRTLVPIRLVSEQLGLVVNWDGKLGTITVE